MKDKSFSTITKDEFIKKLNQKGKVKYYNEIEKLKNNCNDEFKFRINDICMLYFEKRYYHNPEIQKIIPWVNIFWNHSKFNYILSILKNEFDEFILISNEYDLQQNCRKFISSYQYYCKLLDVKENGVRKNNEENIINFKQSKNDLINLRIKNVDDNNVANSLNIEMDEYKNDDADSKNIYCYVKEGKIISACSIKKIQPVDKLFVYRILNAYTLPEFRNNGIGYNVVQSAIVGEIDSKSYLFYDVYQAQENKASIGLAQKLNMEKIHSSYMYFISDNSN